jgi:hypothetical protein
VVLIVLMQVLIMLSVRYWSSTDTSLRMRRCGKISSHIKNSYP